MISITIPVYNEADNLEQLIDEITLAMKRCGKDYEVIFVNDGSTDGSRTILDYLSKQDERIKVIHFHRRFGQTAAMSAGFDHAIGDIIVPMDGDLQNDPADIPRLLDKLDEGYDVVSGWRKDRKDGLFHRLMLSWIANILIGIVTGIKLHDFGCTLKAYRRSVLKGVRLYGEMHRFLPLYASWEGGRITEMVVNHRARRAGSSKYGVTRTYKVLLDLTFLAFMDKFLGKPIYIFGGVGLMSFIIAFASAGASLYFKIWGDKSFIETPLPLLATMTFVTGTMCILMGLLAEMIIRIYYEINDKTTYLVSRKVNLPMLDHEQELTEEPEEHKASIHKIKAIR
jgi:glycosyltransferase involved in cell wall biosynthesis